jgi:hypothetical protein
MNYMNQQSSQATKKKTSYRYWAVGALLALSGMLTGCARPGQDDISRLLNKAYDCKHLELAELVKTDSLPGIYSYVAQYTFQLKFKNGEAGAREFYKGLFAKVEVKSRGKGKDNDWGEWMRADAVQDYIAEECAESSQLALERMIEVVLPQIADKKENLRVPVVIPVTGWSEFMPGRKGWDITMRRDSLDGESLLSEPIKRELLVPKQVSSSGKDKKK